MRDVLKPLAVLSVVDVKTQRFTYELDARYFHTPVVGKVQQLNHVEVFSNPGYTKAWSPQKEELVKTLGIFSHADVLSTLGYTRAVNLGHVQDMPDDELLMCLFEFEKTGDDMGPFLWELERR